MANDKVKNELVLSSMSPLEVTQPRFADYSSGMVLLEKRETRQISLSARGLKARGPAESSNLINERVNYAHIADVDLGAHRKEEWRAQNAVDSCALD